MPTRPKIVIAVPDPSECTALADWLASEGFEPVKRPNAKMAAGEMTSRSFDLLIADAGFAFQDGLHRLGRGRNPATPTVVVGDEAAARQCEAAVGTMYLARPIDHAMLVCTVSMAILDGRPIRQSARKIVSRFAVRVNGMPAHIIDISNEGVRLEIPRDGRPAPLPFFTVKVPLIGVTVNVQRRWAMPTAQKGRQAEVVLCGGVLVQNHLRAEQGWKQFAETLPVAGRPSTVTSIALQ